MEGDRSPREADEAMLAGLFDVDDGADFDPTQPLEGEIAGVELTEAQYAMLRMLVRLCKMGDT